MTKYILGIFLLFLCFIMPIQMYVIGDGFGAGIEGAFYRYQDSSFGSSFIPVSQDVNYVISGTYQGKTALSVLIWLLGGIILALAAVISLMEERHPKGRTLTIVCSLMAVSGMLFLVSVMLQYGIFFSGVAGISLPFGVPLIFISSWYFIKVGPSLTE